MQEETKDRPIILQMDGIILENLCVVPGMVAHIDLEKQEHIQIAERAVSGHEPVLLVSKRNPGSEVEGFDDLFVIGTIAEIKQMVKISGKTVRLLVEGRNKARLLRLEEGIEGFRFFVSPVMENGEKPDDVEKEAFLRNLKDMAARYIMADGEFNKEEAHDILSCEDLDDLMQKLIIRMPFHPMDRQQYLEADGLKERYQVLSNLMEREIEIETMRKDFQSKVKQAIDGNQKEYILREQMRVIREELGEDEESDGDAFANSVDMLEASKEVKDGIRKEIRRFQKLPPNSPESAMVRGYLETLLDMPWDKVSEDKKDLKVAKQILDDDHYGLEKVKDRMIEFLAVRTLTEAKGKSPVVCLVGPPGVGKTSIAKSVAKALDKKYIRLSLGGVRDEAEIRGHRRTYIGAMPGRIATALRKAGTKNPLILLDEIDKVGSDYKGDPAAALLEVLDQEQNYSFRDNYIELPIDLSQVLFIATANTTDTIPGPLLDRMEMIEVNSYTTNEKYHIATEHLFAKQLEENGLRSGQLSIDEDAMYEIIEKYTREAGVRNLERKIGQICRRAARKIVEKETYTVHVTKENLEDFLGKPVYLPEANRKKDEIGLVTGLAWTSVGGTTLEIEVNIMKGKGELVLTGQLGDVMKESAMAALSYVKSIVSEEKDKEEFFSTHDIHVHVPEGAVPKDGPSAGVTMATAIYSAIMEKPVNHLVAMTGEVTLRGRVLPIGGLKEKILASKLFGIKTVLVPEKNKSDVAEISDEITEGLDIVYVSDMKEVLEHAIVE